MNDRLHVLLVEDSPGDARLIRELIHEASPSVSVTHTERLDEAIAQLSSEVFDVALVDLSLPDSNGIETFEAVQAHAPTVPAVVLTGLTDEALAVEAVQRGAQDYLNKGEVTPHLLIQTLRYSIERKRTLLELEANEARFRALLDAVPQSIVIENARNEIVLVNSRAKHRFGYTNDDLRGKSVELLITPDCLAEYRAGRARFLKRPELPGDPVRGIEAVTRSGARFPVEIDHSVVSTRRGSRIICLIEDVTAHHEMLDRLEQTRREELGTKDRFISHVSHELRSPLTAIYLHVEAFLDGLLGELSPEQRSGLELVSRNAAELGAMIEDLIEATKAKGGKLAVTPERVSLAHVVREALERVSVPASARDLKVDESVPDRLDAVWADRKRVLQILGNLLDNAVKFSPRRGRIRLQAEASKEHAGMVLVSVSDQGIGIAAEDLDRIFEELYQSDNALQVTRKGLGLGLFICQQLVAGHGGTIWAESEPDRGSTFFFTLPIASARTAPNGTPHPEARMAAMTGSGVH